MNKPVRIVAWVLLGALLLSLIAAAASAAEPDYATSVNSGIQHQVCTALSAGADNYYTGKNSFEQLDDLSGDGLLSALRSLMTDTHTTITSYSDCRDYATKTDCQQGNGLVTLIYTGYQAVGYNKPGSEYAGSGSNGWNREHVWPKSLGGFDKDGAGADLHHIRPSDYNTNAQRGNSKYGEVEGGSPVKATLTGGKGLLGGYKGSGYFEPNDNVKGDIARICLYVYVRWGGEYSKCSKITNVFQSVDVLLAWCALDPVDTWEMGRNEVVENIQGNRNVFIDYPELAWLLFDKDIPADMTTPSSGTGSAPPQPTEPTPTEPAPTEPAPTEPAPTEPAPTEPAPTEPAPTEPAPTEPAPTEPAPTEPAPTEPAPTEPAPTEPAPTEPAPTEPAPTEPAPTEPVPTEPAPTEPSGVAPGWTFPVGLYILIGVGIAAVVVVVIVILRKKK